MNTRELARAIQAQTGIPAYQTQRVISAMHTIIRAETHRGQPVKLGSIGTFRRKLQKAGKHHNIHTKELDSLPQRWQIAFKIGRAFKKG